jgi:KipI family sensor histidine kinase inhibitor
MGCVPGPHVEPASDHSMLACFGASLDAGAHERVRRLFLSLCAQPLEGALNLHPAYASLLVDFDPLHPGAADLADELRRRIATASDSPASPPRLVEIPVCYGGEMGPDLEAVALHCGLAPAEVIERYSAPEYLVAFLGFSPGFPYLSGLDPTLATPRLASPRKLVPAGSVAIGGGQAGIYPSASPGGWRIIGRTPLQIFDPHRQPPALLEMGDRLRFRPISLEESQAWPG